MRIQYRQKCLKCKKNYVTVVSGQKFPVCYDCQKEELSKDIKNPKMKKLFSIPEKFYKENAFLRSIKINYFRYGSLTEKQIAAFKKTVKELRGD
jgi:dTDP-4-dehydrorhamnose 3,5-epimerase-like enzyme